MAVIAGYLNRTELFHGIIRFLRLSVSCLSTMEPGNYRVWDRATDSEEFKWTSNLPNRPGLNTVGRAITVRVNQFKVTQWPEKDVYQYDVSLPPQIILHLL